MFCITWYICNWFLCFKMWSRWLVSDNDYEKKLIAAVSPYDVFGVRSNDIGALEKVKQTLEELVVLPLQRPKLFDKEQLGKLNALCSKHVKWSNLLFIFSRYKHICSICVSSCVMEYCCLCLLGLIKLCLQMSHQQNLELTLWRYPCQKLHVNGRVCSSPRTFSCHWNFLALINGTHYFAYSGLVKEKNMWEQFSPCLANYHLASILLIMLV